MCVANVFVNFIVLHVFMGLPGTTMSQMVWQNSLPAQQNPADPFNAQWAATSAQPTRNTNPFITSQQPSNIKAFTVQM